MDIVKMLLKVLVIAFVYLGIGPMLGFYLNGKDKARRITLAVMAWLLVRPTSDLTLTLYSVEMYRGHCRGFEFNLLEGLSISLAIAALLEKRKDFRFFPPGLWAWLLWIVICSLSIASAINPIYGLMPLVKFAKMSIVFIGIFAALHDDRDVKAMMRGFAVALVVQTVVCLWARYVQGGFQIRGWFEHQNPMAMWTYMTALPILGLALSKETKPRDVLLFFSAFGGSGLVVILSISRASLAAFAVGSAIVLVTSFLQGFTFRRAALGSFAAICGVAILFVAADTFMLRVGSDDSPKNDLRYALNKQAAAMNRDHPLTGIGWNNYGLANSRPLGTKYSQVMERWEASRGSRIYVENFRANPLTESLYWLLLAENGTLGFITFLLFASITLWHGFRATVGHWRSPIGLFLFGVMVALAITYFHMQVERVLVQTKNLTTWIMFCATLSRAEWWRRQRKANRHLQSRSI